MAKVLIINPVVRKVLKPSRKSSKASLRAQEIGPAFPELFPATPTANSPYPLNDFAILTSPDPEINIII